ncbi:MAG: VWA domain-containing protein [Ruminococcus sp.]|nr:VWA domain-containing protein [Ruminococcus sp.]
MKKDFKITPNTKIYPIAAVFDISSSMSHLEPVLNRAAKNLRTQPNLSERDANNVLVTLITFNSDVKVYDTVPLSQFDPPYMKTEGCTSMGAAIESAIDRLDSLKLSMKGVRMNKPAIFMLTDGYPTDEVRPAISKLKESNYSFYGFGLNEDAVNAIAQISPNHDAFLINSSDNGESLIYPFIDFVSESICEVSQKREGESAMLSVPANTQYIVQKT